MKRIKEWILGCVGLILGFLGVNLLIFRILFPGPKKRWEQDTYDCAVVCGYHAEEGGSPSRVMKCRVEKAAELWKSPPGRISPDVWRCGEECLRGSRGYEAVCDGAWCSGAIYCGRKRGGLHLPQPEKCSKSDEELWIF